MTPQRPRAFTLAALALALSSMALTACSAGSLGSSGGGSGTAITFLTDNNSATIRTAEALAADFNAKNPGITVRVESRPGGSEGDNIIKTRLQTDSMTDVFLYNAGSLFQQIGPQENLTPLTAEPFMQDVEDTFKPQVSAGSEVYGVPWGTAMMGGVLYNKRVYEQLGLQVPKTWTEFIANSEKIKAAGIAPVIQTYQTTWTSQLLVLGDFHNVAAANPSFAADYTANRAKYATDPAAIKGFEHLQQIHEMGLQNADFAAANQEDGLRLLADGEGAQYPMLTNAIATLQGIAPERVNDIGFFALPGDDAATNGGTTWFPAGVYVPNTTTGERLDAVKKFLAYLASPAGCTKTAEVAVLTGPFMVEGCELPADVSPVTKDVQAYFDAGAQSPALEYLSPVKGPSLEQITVEVGSGIRSARDGAALYDSDVEKQAQQLDLEGW